MTCPFCALDPGEILLQGERCLVIETRDPVLLGSGMIVPREHRETVFDLTPEEWSETYTLLQQARALLDARYQPDGYNVGWNSGAVGGQEVLHAHLHVIPRFHDEPLAGKGIRYALKQPTNRRPGFTPHPPTRCAAQISAAPTSSPARGRGGEANQIASSPIRAGEGPGGEGANEKAPSPACGRGGWG